MLPKKKRLNFLSLNLIFFFENYFKTIGYFFCSKSGETTGTGVPAGAPAECLAEVDLRQFTIFEESNS